ncbi:MAG TPA: prepilin-type N-terminal cleavage/methylation domain-containing protein [Verrucomicrobiae bacterium]|nr:prepilin-type N-terminal cleavage/methylation domain-containing protein [Verrucomicrobiae bacterium]
MKLGAKPTPRSGDGPLSRADQHSARLAFLRARARRGFTLVEILIAMGILSLVLAAIYSSWTAILRASKVGTETAAAVQRARMASRTIEESLGSAVSFAANQQYYFFDAENGDNSSLSFVTHLGPSFPRSGKFGDFTVRRVTFTVEKGRDGTSDLMLRQQPLLMDMDKDEQEFPLVLAKDVKSFKTEFWDLQLQDWTDEWKQTNQLPVMVKVSLEIADNPLSARKAREQIVRIVSLPSMMVQPGFQVPRLPGLMPGQQLQPGPGQVPGQIPGQLTPGQQGYPGSQPLPH